MNIDTILAEAGLTQDQIESLKEEGLTEVEHLVDLEVSDLVEIGVKKFSAKRLIRKVRETSPPDPVEVPVAVTPSNIFVTLDQGPKLLEEMSVIELFDVLLGEDQDQAVEAAKLIDGQVAAFIVSDDEGKVDRDKSLACYRHNRETRTSSRTWEGYPVRSAQQVVKGPSKLYDPVTGDVLTANKYNNQGSYSWADVPEEWMAVAAFAAQQGKLSGMSGRQVVKELSTEEKDDFWMSLSREFKVADTTTRAMVEASLTQPRRSLRPLNPDPISKPPSSTAGVRGVSREELQRARGVGPLMDLPHSHHIDMEAMRTANPPVRLFKAIVTSLTQSSDRTRLFWSLPTPGLDKEVALVGSLNSISDSIVEVVTRHGYEKETYAFLMEFAPRRRAEYKALYELGGEPW